jgi:hypothetical protein
MYPLYNNEYRILKAVEAAIRKVVERRKIEMNQIRL